jgi:hypothetical protein
MERKLESNRASSSPFFLIQLLFHSSYSLQEFNKGYEIFADPRMPSPCIPTVLENQMYFLLLTNDVFFTPERHPGTFCALDF